MKWCVWNGGSCVWLVIITATLHNSLCQDMCPKGELRVTGLNTTNLIAGHIELCTGAEWRAVCSEGWDVTDAMVVCRQLGFPAEGAIYCHNSCFGNSTQQNGVQRFNCNGTEMRLIACPSVMQNTDIICKEYAGVVCTNMTTVTSDQFTRPPLNNTCGATDDLPHQQTTTAETNPITTMGEREGGASDAVYSTAGGTTGVTTEGTTEGTAGGTTEGTDGEGSYSGDSTPFTESSDEVGGRGDLRHQHLCTALGGGLGTLSAVLIILLVGVVLGWVWSCRKRKRISCIHERHTTGQMNPTYSSTSPYHSIQYSSSDLNDTPASISDTYAVVNKDLTHNATPLYAVINEAPKAIPLEGEGERIYHVLEAPGEGEWLIMKISRRREGLIRCWGRCEEKWGGALSSEVPENSGDRVLLYIVLTYT